MSVHRIRDIVEQSVTALFRQIAGGRIKCESEATLQLHLGRIIATVADLEIVGERETLSIELEKPLRGGDGKRGRIDVWFQLTDTEGSHWRCSIELKFFKRVNQREPNNRYDVFKDIFRLERSGDVTDVGFMLVATDHPHYISQRNYSKATSGFDFRNGAEYRAGTLLTYATGRYGSPITLARDYSFTWRGGDDLLQYLLVEVAPTTAA